LDSSFIDGVLLNVSFAVFIFCSFNFISISVRFFAIVFSFGISDSFIIKSSATHHFAVLVFTCLYFCRSNASCDTQIFFAVNH